MKKSDYKWVNLRLFKYGYIDELAERIKRCRQNNGVPPDEDSIVEAPHKFLDFQGYGITENPEITRKNGDGETTSGHAFRAENLAAALEFIGCLRRPLANMYGSNDAYEANNVSDSKNLPGKDYEPHESGDHNYNLRWDDFCVKDSFKVEPWDVDVEFVVRQTLVLAMVRMTIGATYRYGDLTYEAPTISVTGRPLENAEDETDVYDPKLSPVFGLALLFRSLDFDVNRDWEYLESYAVNELSRDTAAAISVKYVRGISSYIDSEFDTGEIDVTEETDSHEEAVATGITGMCGKIDHFTELISDDEMNNLSSSVKLGEKLGREDFADADEDQKAEFAYPKWEDTEGLLEKLVSLGSSGFYLTDRHPNFPRGEFFISESAAEDSVDWDGGEDPGYTYTTEITDTSTKTDTNCNDDESGGDGSGGDGSGGDESGDDGSGDHVCIDNIQLANPGETETTTYKWDGSGDGGTAGDARTLFTKSIGGFYTIRERRDTGQSMRTVKLEQFNVYTYSESYCGGKMPFVYNLGKTLDAGSDSGLGFKNSNHEFHQWVDASNMHLYVGISIDISYSVDKYKDNAPAGDGREWSRSIKFMASADFSRSYVGTDGNFYGVWMLDLGAVISRIRGYADGVSFNDIEEDPKNWKYSETYGPVDNPAYPGQTERKSAEGVTGGGIDIEASICEYPDVDSETNAGQNVKKGRPPRFVGPIKINPS